NVDHGGYASLDDELKDVEFLGAPEVAVETKDENCKV
ncbi:unnamed protein product, partial [marine sediment metagenome]